MHREASDAEAKGSGHMLEQIRAVFAQVEASEPWKDVFHDKLALPVGEAQHPVLASSLRRFLGTHGRAMWERSFWVPCDADELYARMKRQEDLHAAGHGHEGWWYRRPIVDLVHVTSHEGVAMCVEYIQTQQRARLPTVGGGYKPRQFRGHYNWSDSMWSCDGALRHALNEVRRLKGTNDDDRDGASEQHERELEDDGGDDGDARE